MIELIQTNKGELNGQAFCNHMVHAGDTEWEDIVKRLKLLGFNIYSVNDAISYYCDICVIS